MKGLVATAIAGLVSPGVAQAQTAAPAAAAPTLTVYVAKKIITMDRGWPEATAVAVEGGKILSVGSLDDLKPWTDARPHTIDRRFADKVLMPGFIEAHGHPLIGGLSLTRPLLTYLPVPNPYGPAFPGVKTKHAAIQKLGEYVAKASTPDEVVVAWGYDVIAFGGELLDKHELDAVSATRPVIVWDASEHLTFANSAALRKFGIAKKDTNTDGIKAGPDGEPNGQFLGTRATQSIMQAALADTFQPAIAMRSMKFLMDLARKNGITTFSELAFGAVNIDLETFLFDQYFNDQPIRCVNRSGFVGGWFS